MTNDGRFGYTGQTWLKQLGLNYYKARIYSPKLGRFLQTDPIFYKDDMNLYSYVGNDPVDRTDPSGNSCVTKNNDQGRLFAESCTVDIDRDKLVKKYGAKAVGMLETAYKDAVNKLLSKGKYASTTFYVRRLDGKGFLRATASAHDVAKNLIDRKVGYRPDQSDSLATSTDFKRTDVGNEFGRAAKGIDPLSPLISPHAELVKAWTHEGLHSPEVHKQLGPEGRWLKKHSDWFDRAADDLLEK